MNTYLSRFDAMADKAAAQVIAQYSTSFSLAVRTLPKPERTHIRNLYAVVRIADEIVDGTTTQANESWRRAPARSAARFRRSTSCATSGRTAAHSGARTLTPRLTTL